MDVTTDVVPSLSAGKGEISPFPTHGYIRKKAVGENHFFKKIVFEFLRC